MSDWICVVLRPVLYTIRSYARIRIVSSRMPIHTYAHLFERLAALYVYLLGNETVPNIV
jgi:hypothetical protein